jgi:methyl-accepting chemotaxis protein
MMKLTIARQLTLMTVITMLILLAVGVIGNRVAHSVGSAVEYSEETAVPAVEAIALMRLTFLELRIALQGHMTTWDDDEKKQLDARIVTLGKTFSATLDDYEKLAARTDDTDRQLLAADRQAYTDFAATLEPVLEQSRNSQNTVAKELLVKSQPAVAKLGNDLDAHTAHAKKLLVEHSKAADTAFARGNLLSIASIVLGMLILGGFSLALNRNIGRGLDLMERAVSRVETELDLTVRVPERRTDEIGRMGTALNRLLARLQESFRAVAQAAAQVSQSAEAMSGASDQVAASSETQSAAATSMAANVQQLTVSINHVGDRATTTRERVANAGKLSTEGESIVVKTVADIDAIAASVAASADLINKLETQSQQINSVMNVIKEVADQTNLLALNAAIEAARAGEQGRGFAVVADEVRKLAERTGRSAQEISTTIGAMREGAQAAAAGMRDAVEQVGAGVSRASGACEMIRKIGEGSREAVAMVSEITDAIHEQSTASVAVAQSVERIAQMAERSSAVAGDSAQTAQRLNALAQEMRVVAEQYKI